MNSENSNNPKMTTCNACGKEIAKGRKVSCPSCGKTNKPKLYKRPWFIVLLLFVFFYVIGSTGDTEDTIKQNTQNTQNANTEIEKEIIEEEILVVTANEMVDELKENALRAERTYKDKKVEVTGVVSNIDSSGKYFSISIIPESEFSFELYRIQCFINEEHLDDVLEFIKDQEVTVIGKVTMVGEVLGYSLNVESIKK